MAKEILVHQMAPLSGTRRVEMIKFVY